MSGANSLSLERIAHAARVIDPVFLHTPQFVSSALSDRLGVRRALQRLLTPPCRFPCTACAFYARSGYT